MLFMGQEFLEDKQLERHARTPGHLICWDGLGTTDKAMRDFLRFCRDLIALRTGSRACAASGSNAFHAHDGNRVIAFHRWVEGAGRDVVVVASLNESTYRGYELGFPGPGRWTEVFNSDVYDNWVNPPYAGNGGSIVADGPPRDAMPCSASLVIPANGFLVFVPG